MKSIKNSQHLKLNEAINFQNKGDNKKAVFLFLQVLKSQPTNTLALYSLAAIESNTGNNAVALTYANRAIASNQNFAQAYLARSTILLKLGKLDEALADVDMALALDADLAGARVHKEIVEEAKKSGSLSVPAVAGPSAEMNSIALKLQDQGKLSEAQQVFRKVAERYPDDFIALYSLGVLESRSGNPEQAMHWMSKAVESNPTNSLGHYALATILQGMALYEQALDSFDAALELNPNYMEAYNNKATLLHSMNRHLDALKTLEVALGVMPQDQKSLNNKGYILTEFKQNTLAANVFQYLLKLNPVYEYAQGLHMLARLHSCDWTNYEENKKQIVEGVRSGQRVCNPFALMAITDNADDHLKCAGNFGEHRFPASKVQMWNGEVYRHRKKRVAFISADFREHPVGYLLIGLIENFDKNRFETYGVSLGTRDGSALYTRYRNGFDHYLDCADKSSVEVARILRAMEIDIAIDLSGYTSGARLDILAHRPAPVQATYLGFPGGLNVPYVDYLIADHLTVPEEMDCYYREKILRLPHCYLPRDTAVLPDPRTPERKDFALPEDGLVFCSFNHDYKINPSMFEIWMSLLSENPKSALWLMKLNEDAQNNLNASADRFGIDPKRIVFATRVPRIEDHLARYRLADICLDTFPYNGHTTTSDALLAGIPVVTLSGQGFASRVAASLLNDFGLESSCAQSLTEYKNIAQRIISEGNRRMNDQQNIDKWPNNEVTQANNFCDLLDAI